MVTAVTSTTEKRGVVFTFLSRLLYNSSFLCKFAELNQFVHGMAQNIYQYRIGTSRHG